MAPGRRRLGHQALRPAQGPHRSGAACPAAQRHARWFILLPVSAGAGEEERQAPHRRHAQSLLPGLVPPRRLACGAEPLYVPALAQNGFLPDYAALPEEALSRVAALYVCSPSNPEGAVADEAYWRRLFELAERHDFLVLADECYADIWFDQPPACALDRALRPVERLFAAADLPFPFQALGAAGPAQRHGGRLRQPDREAAGLPQCGGAAGAQRPSWRPAPPAGRTRLMSPPTAPPIRRRWRRLKTSWATAIKRPGGGFFLWLDVGNGEETALESVAAKRGARCYPAPIWDEKPKPGKTQSNPGFSYVRIALVNDLSTILTALERVRNFLDRA